MRQQLVDAARGLRRQPSEHVLKVGVRVGSQLLDLPLDAIELPDEVDGLHREPDGIDGSSQPIT